MQGDSSSPGRAPGDRCRCVLVPVNTITSVSGQTKTPEPAFYVNGCLIADAVAYQPLGASGPAYSAVRFLDGYSPPVKPEPSLGRYFVLRTPSRLASSMRGEACGDAD